MTDTYGTKTLEKTLEGLKRSLMWAETSKSVAESELTLSNERIVELTQQIEEIEKDLSFLRNY